MLLEDLIVGITWQSFLYAIMYFYLAISRQKDKIAIGIIVLWFFNLTFIIGGMFEFNDVKTAVELVFFCLIFYFLFRPREKLKEFFVWFGITGILLFIIGIGAL